MPTILVIEDEEGFLTTICDLLEANNFDTIQAEDGEKGIELAQKYKPALILCDYMMPKKDGIQVIEERNIAPELSSIPFIFLSVYDDEELIIKAYKNGAQDYITKTTDNKEIITRIRTHLSLKESGKILKLVDLVN